MDLHHELLGFVGILREAINIFRKNGKLMASVSALTLLSYSLWFLLNIFSTKPLMVDLAVKATTMTLANPKSPVFVDLFYGVKEDVLFILGLEAIYFLLILISMLVSVTATIYASSMTYCGNSYLPFKGLLSSIVKSSLRPFMTWFYITLFSTGYTFHVFVIAVPFYVLIHRWISYAFLFLALIFYTYLQVTWTLSLVISVLEEKCYGIEALGKAGKLIKGMKIQGFCLNFVFTLVMIGVLQGIRLMGTKQTESTQIFIGLIVVNSICFVQIFRMTAYTILYCLCKKTHGEEVELQGSLEYTKIGTSPLITNEYLP